MATCEHAGRHTSRTRSPRAGRNGQAHREQAARVDSALGRADSALRPRELPGATPSGQSARRDWRFADNERGVIARECTLTEGLGVLAAARQAYPLPKGSPQSTTRAVFQAAELALLNLTDVIARAAHDVDASALGADGQTFWARGFHRVLSRLSLLPQQFGFPCEPDGPHGILRIGDAPAFREYLEVLREFDRAVLREVEAGALPLRACARGVVARSPSIQSGAYRACMQPGIDDLGEQPGATCARPCRLPPMPSSSSPTVCVQPSTTAC